MSQPRVDDVVRLIQDIPNLSLHRNDVGIIRSTWFSPELAYEVEFHQIGQDCQTRTLLRPDQIQLEDGPLLGVEWDAVERSPSHT